MQKYDFFFNTIKMKLTKKVLTYHFYYIPVSSNKAFYSLQKNYGLKGTVGSTTNV